MAGRPKIQFANEADGELAWKLIEEVTDWHHAEDLRDFERKVGDIRSEFPDATVNGLLSRPSAGKIILRLLQNEVENINREKRRRMPNVGPGGVGWDDD